jgi:multiple sugar transport system permease protein/putative aldouronate transport system permease protein
LTSIARPRKLKEAPVHSLSAKTPIGKSDRAFYLVNGFLLILFFLLVLLPILTVFANAFSNSNAVAGGKVTFWPLIRHADGSYGLGVTLDGFQAVFRNNKVLNGYWNTITYTVLGTSLNLFLTILAAYPLSRDDLPGRNWVMMLFAFTMLFNGGMIPNFILIKDLGIYNTLWAMVLPMGINVYNMVICRTFFKNSIPKELLEASQLDGCTDARFVWSIVLPLSKAIIAVIALYYGVFHWNAYFNAFLYLTRQDLYPLQIVLKEILISSVVSPEMLEGAQSGSVDVNMIHLLRYSLIVVACLPIWCVYPFLQKYFVQGVMIGSVKG